MTLLQTIRFSACRMLIGLTLSGMLLLIACSRNSEHDAASPGFVDNRLCIDCHPAQYEQWRGSHHDLAMQPANETTVLGNFADAVYGDGRMEALFYRREGRYFVKTEDAGGERREFEIKYTFGVTPLQQYLIEFPGGRLQALSIAWDDVKQRWYHLYPEERFAENDPLHWTGIYQNWNSMCAECHSTGLEKNYDPATNTFATTWNDINVACQTCHGPGESHVMQARAAAGGSGFPDSSYGLIDNPGDSAQRQLETCAPCHSRRQRISGESPHGKPFLDSYQPELLAEGLYFPDGQILEEVYVYGSFLQSKMYRRGVRCSDCHNPHSLRPVADGNQLCTRCHSPHPDPGFPTLTAKDYDSPSHHFHPASSPGALCVNCHMPARVYMGIDARRDHSFRIPRPDLNAKLGVPDPCTGCHQDRSAQWAEAALQKWYPARLSPTHFAEAFAAGRSGRPEAAAALQAVAADTAQAGIVRASALELLRNYPLAGREHPAAYLQDGDPLVRLGAVRRLEVAAPAVRAGLLAPLLSDSLRAVRIEAARLLASLPQGALADTDRERFADALHEYRQAQWFNAERPAAQFNLALLYENLGKADSALIAYRAALARDRYYVPAWFNLGYLYNRLGRNREAEKVFREAIAALPDLGELYYSLGLLLAEENKLTAALDYLQTAAEKLPENARVWYNYGLSLQHAGRPGEAEGALRRAGELEPQNTVFLRAQAILAIQQERWPQAQAIIRRWLAIAPQDPEALQLQRRVAAQGDR